MATVPVSPTPKASGNGLDLNGLLVLWITLGWERTLPCKFEAYSPPCCCPVSKIGTIEFVRLKRHVPTAQTTGSTCNLICMEREECSKQDGTRALGRRLVDAFGSGWAQANLDLLMSVYTPDVVFVETPFSTALHGHDSVRRYWADVPYNQSEVTFSSGEIFAAGPWFSTEFKCRFRRRRTGEWVEARGAIFCETAGDRISEMRMYWHRWNGGKETGKP